MRFIPSRFNKIALNRDDDKWISKKDRISTLADDAYSIWSTWSCYWLDQFLTLALDAWILSKFSTLYWICLLLVFLILVGVELPLCL